MKNINGPPLKHQALKATLGIDSVHILIDMNRFDLRRFCKDCKYTCKAKGNLKYRRKWLLFLADGESITATYHFKSRTMKFEIGKLLNYSINPSRQRFLQELVAFFSSRKISITRLDVAADISFQRDDLIVKNLSKIISSKRVSSTTYENANGHTLIAYDKSSRLKIFSTNLTRIELRLTTQLASWNVKNFMSNKSSYDKLVGKIEHYFQERMRLYSNDRLTRYIINMDIKSALGDFIAFVHGDVYKYKDHFRVEDAINKRDTFFDWMKTNKLTPKKINHFVKGRRAAVCLELGFSSKTFKKAVNFYKAIPNFKF